MKYLLVTALVFLSSSYSFADCISLEKAKAIALEQISKAQTLDPQGNAQGDYDTWLDAMDGLEYIIWKGVGSYTYSWSVSNWEDARMSVDCSGKFSVTYSNTED